ncbi:MAG: MaoC/PaaZ C-terminal domain-containing protein, partial [Bacteroidota bacterium]
STLMPYKTMDEAIALSKMGKGSLCSSIVTYNDTLASAYSIGAASHHGRILILNRENAKQSTGHGSPLPTLVHGGPGRAGGGEEMGGVRGIKHYLQRCAIQGTPTTITEITGVYQAKAAYKEAEAHPFKYHWEDIQAGMSIKTHKRTITDTDIINFGNLSWDHFYAHTDITSLEHTIFEKRVAHGYFILSAAAGLFVYPHKGPVAANYGLEDCRFIKPVYHNDTIYVRLTCKEKVDTDTRGRQFPSGIVKWYVEVFDKDDELAAIATILTMVQKKNPFKELSRDVIATSLAKLHEDTQPKWGIMTPQHMIEHLEWTLKIAAGELPVTEIITPEEHLEKTQESLYDYKPMPRNYEHPLLKKGALEALVHSSLDEAKVALLEAYEKYVLFFEEHPEAVTRHAVFGDLDKSLWKLLHRKHIHHHFEQFGIV